MERQAHAAGDAPGTAGPAGSGRAGLIARDIMRPPVTTIERDGHAAGAAYLMRHHDASAIVVLDDASARRPDSVLTEGDLVRAVGDGQDLNEVRIRDLATHGIPTVDVAAGLDEVGRAMAEHQVRHVLVTENGRLAGVIDAQAVVAAKHGRS